MTIDALPAGEAVFIDANIFTYHFQPHPIWGQACTHLLQRVENQELPGFTSIQVLAELSHRLMTLEACVTFGWPFAGIGNRLRSNPTRVQRLKVFRTAIEQILQGRLQLLTVTPTSLGAAVAISQQEGLLLNDALIVAVMNSHSITNLASGDTDFDRISAIKRYGPV